MIFKYMKDISREGNKLFSRQFSISIASVARNNGLELQQDRLKLDALQRGRLASTKPTCLAKM